MPAEVDVVKLANLVRAKRGSLGLRTAADQIGDVSASTLSRVEAGKVPDLDTFLRICEWLGMEPRELLQDTDAVLEAAEPPDTPELMAAHLRADRVLDPQTKQALETMIRLAYKAAKDGLLPGQQTTGAGR